MDGGRPQQKHGCFFAGTCSTGNLTVGITKRQRPCEVPFLFATFSLGIAKKK